MTNPGFKDHFSASASDYATFRPRYPAELFEFVASLPERRSCVWDCATGNGQAALPLSMESRRCCHSCLSRSSGFPYVACVADAPFG